MRVAVVGSRGIRYANLDEYLPDGIDEIVSGGAVGIDTLAKDYARRHGLRLTEFLPDYGRYGRGAPLVRNEQIVDYADCVYAFWDGRSTGTRHVVRYARMKGKPCHVFKLTVTAPNF